MCCESQVFIEGFDMIYLQLGREIPNVFWKERIIQQNKQKRQTTRSQPVVSISINFRQMLVQTQSKIVHNFCAHIYTAVHTFTITTPGNSILAPTLALRYPGPNESMLRYGMSALITSIIALYARTARYVPFIAAAAAADALVACLSVDRRSLNNTA